MINNVLFQFVQKREKLIFDIFFFIEFKNYLQINII